jgi:hypothetical protein
MHQSGYLRSQPPNRAEDNELRVLPFPETTDLALQSFLNELLKQYRDVFQTEKSGFPQLSEQLELPLAIPSVQPSGGSIDRSGWWRLRVKQRSSRHSAVRGDV